MGPLEALRKLPYQCVTSSPKFLPQTTYHPPKNFLSIYFLIYSAISCQLVLLSTAWLITCLASYSTSDYIYEQTIFTPQRYARLSIYYNYKLHQSISSPQNYTATSKRNHCVLVKVFMHCRKCQVISLKSTSFTIDIPASFISGRQICPPHLTWSAIFIYWPFSLHNSYTSYYWKKDILHLPVESWTRILIVAIPLGLTPLSKWMICPIRMILETGLVWQKASSYSSLTWVSWRQLMWQRGVWLNALRIFLHFSGLLVGSWPKIIYHYQIQLNE